ncbi:MAG: winged helix-turn-helix domain-containing protein [Zhaonellaceae bacterium]|jgi:molybdate transport system regulatory protein|nr:LysR family transcriptional regulator [Clostridia bacterium]
MYILRYKLWLEKDGKAFGEGPYQLLAGILETGSLSNAAKKLNMSYSLAYNLIKKVEKNLGFPLIQSKSGGQGGGGSVLTPEALDLMEKYNGFLKESASALEKLFAKYFNS